MESIEAKLWDFIVDNNIATEDEVTLVTYINGWSEETMTDIIYARTGLRSYEQCVNDGFSGTNDLDRYYGIDEDSRKDHAREVISDKFPDVDSDLIEEFIEDYFGSDSTDGQIVDEFEDFLSDRTDDESDED